MKGYLIKKIQKLLFRMFGKLLQPIVTWHRLETPAVVGDPLRLHISSSASVHNAYFNLLSGDIHIGSHVFFGHNVSLITGTHDYTKVGHGRSIAVPREGHDIIIEDGSWIAGNVTIIGPCRIGQSAVVSAGAVVVKDVAPFTVVGGVPAKFLRAVDPFANTNMQDKDFA